MFRPARLEDRWGYLGRAIGCHDSLPRPSSGAFESVADGLQLLMRGLFVGGSLVLVFSRVLGSATGRQAISSK